MQIFDPLQRRFESGNWHIVEVQEPKSAFGMVRRFEESGCVLLESGDAVGDSRAFLRLVKKYVEMVRHQNIAKASDCILVSVEFEGFKNLLAKRRICKPRSANRGDCRDKVKTMSETDL
jgi:hypothetical protein